jgi:hypothetical protein
VKATALPPQGHRRVIAVASSIAAMLALGSGVFLATRTTAAGGAVASRHMDAWVDDFGVGFTMKTTFQEGVTLSAPALRVGGVETEAELWPLDGHDHEGEDLDPLRLAAGTPVSISGWLLPGCNDSDLEVTMSVTSVDSDGEETNLRYSGSNEDDLESAMRQLCARGPTVTGEMNLLRPNGDAVIGIKIVNPGPDEITVDVPGYSDDHVTWSALNGTVPAGQRARFEIYGSDVGCEPGETASWQQGRLLIDGQPFIVTSDDRWC